MKEITLSNGYTALVDDEDYAKVIDITWHGHPRQRNIYVQSNQWIIDENNNRKCITRLMHRVVLNITDPKIFIDHRDNNGLNNCKDNLRIASNQENAFNQKKSSTGSSQYKGVSWNKRKRKWEANIKKNYKQIYLGAYINENDAAKVYNEKAKELFGEFTKLNILD